MTQVPVRWNAQDKFWFTYIEDILNIYINDFFTSEPVLVRVYDLDVHDLFKQLDLQWWEFKFPELEYMAVHKPLHEIKHKLKKFKKRQKKGLHREWGIIRLVKKSNRWGLRMAHPGMGFNKGYYIDEYPIFTQGGNPMREVLMDAYFSSKEDPANPFKHGHVCLDPRKEGYGPERRTTPGL